MRFRPGARLDPSQVEDRRGPVAGRSRWAAAGSASRRGHLPPVRAARRRLRPALRRASTASRRARQPPSQSLGADCSTGADANTRQDCRILGDVNSVQAYWSGWFRAHGKHVRAGDRPSSSPARRATGCGTATTDVGPFYCPVDRNVYIDLGFYEELHDRFGAQGGPFAEAYVIAHEYGHHAQDLLGDLAGRRSQGATGSSVRTELQADCYAGVWARNAVATGYIVDLTARRTSTTGSTLRPPSATTGSSRRRRGRSTRRPGRTARRPSARSGSRAATSAASRAAATRSAARCDR